MARKCSTETDYPGSPLLHFCVRRGRGKNDQVLARKKVKDLLQTEPHRLDFRTHLRECHLMLGFDRHSGILSSILNEHQSPVWFQCAAYLSHGFFRIRKLVVHINHKREVKLAGGKFGLGWRCQYRLNIREARFLHVGLKKREHFWLNIGREYTPVWTDPLRET